MTRIIRASVVVLVLGAIVAVMIWSETSGAAGQRRRRPAQRRKPTVPAIDYSQFSHSTRKHQQACDTCHKIPTGTWQSVRGFPDITDYPGHASCVSCHRAQFFRGARPEICSGCHSIVSPRDDVRLPFRNPKVAQQFTIEFPHDKHQDVIARIDPLFRTQRQAYFAHAAPTIHDDKAQTYNNCTICHLTRSSVSPAPVGGWTDGYTPDELTFKTVPANHAACFNCHWKSQQPVSSNCAGCHKPVEPHAPPGLPKRISIKFKHEGGGEKMNHVAECTSCHINITKAATLRGLKPDVPITACTECHNKAGLREDLNKELEAIDKDARFVCAYCHTSDVGRKDPPAGHYLVAGRPPLMRKNVK